MHYSETLKRVKGACPLKLKHFKIKRFQKSNFKHINSKNVKSFFKGGQGACPLKLKDFQINNNFSIKDVGCYLNGGQGLPLKLKQF